MPSACTAKYNSPERIDLVAGSGYFLMPPNWQKTETVAT